MPVADAGFRKGGFKIWPAKAAQIRGVLGACSSRKFFKNECSEVHFHAFWCILLQNTCPFNKGT